ncbi:hypothetical protein Vadar_033881 [Vaccinium darrowii]|uniref:Uncharacterized protein n=1 Tax=Vaccinium darrowii TaxID=229202 RepID=A0ACB7YIE9_9ERIC|nr:hypothetical protein Vadar_033881 [Vaccinium darrowii]
MMTNFSDRNVTWGGMLTNPIPISSTPPATTTATALLPYAAAVEHHHCHPISSGVSSIIDCEGQLLELEGILDSQVYMLDDRTQLDKIMASTKKLS